jgi:hypothetical protein
MSKHKYVPRSPSDIPAGVRFDVPQRHQGHIVEVAFGGFDRGTHDDGDPYMRVHDQSDNATDYYRLATTKQDATLLRAQELVAGYLAEARKLGNKPACQVWKLAQKQLSAPPGSPLAQGQEGLAYDIVKQHEDEQSEP